MKKVLSVAAVALVLGGTISVQADSYPSKKNGSRVIASDFQRNLKDVFNPALVGEKSATFVSIQSGTFQMGSPTIESHRFNDETLHTVTISRGFEMSSTTVTQLQWFMVMDFNPSYFASRRYCEDYVEINGTGICPNNPVERVSWDDAQSFLSHLNNGQDGYVYRLPTEAEWEYSARAGTQTAYSFGNIAENYNAGLPWLGDYAWGWDDRSHPVGTKKPNPWGLYDMQGNVWQWVQDWYEVDYYRLPATDPLGLSGSYRGIRGGGWGDGAELLRSADRGSSGASGRYANLGFRLVRTKP